MQKYFSVERLNKHLHITRDSHTSFCKTLLSALSSSILFPFFFRNSPRSMASLGSSPSRSLRSSTSSCKSLITSSLSFMCFVNVSIFLEKYQPLLVIHSVYMPTNKFLSFLICSVVIKKIRLLAYLVFQSLISTALSPQLLQPNHILP